MMRCNKCDREFSTEDALAMHNTAKHYVYAEKKKYNKFAMGWIIGIIVILLIGGYVVWNNNSNTNSLNGGAVYGSDVASGASNTEIQKITLSLKNFNYYPNTIRVKERVPVEIELDESIGGCYRSFMIKDLGVKEYSSNPSQTITFVPNKKGTFEFACGMRMGRGTIIVE